MHCWTARDRLRGALHCRSAPNGRYENLAQHEAEASGGDAVFGACEVQAERTTSASKITAYESNLNPRLIVLFSYVCSLQTHR